MNSAALINNLQKIEWEDSSLMMNGQLKLSKNTLSVKILNVIYDWTGFDPFQKATHNYALIAEKICEILEKEKFDNITEVNARKIFDAITFIEYQATKSGRQNNVLVTLADIFNKLTTKM